MGELEQKLLNYHVVLMAIAAWIILWALRKIWKGFDEIEIVRKLKPLYAAALCQGFIWIPGVLPDATTGERVLTAIWSGFLASIGYQLLRRFVKAKTGAELPEDPDKLEPGGAPDDDEKERDTPVPSADGESNEDDDKGDDAA